MTKNEVLAVQSTEVTDKLMVIVTRPTYVLHGTDVFDGIVTASLHEVSEILIGSKMTFPVREIIG